MPRINDPKLYENIKEDANEFISKFNFIEKLKTY
jgi:hypothetical protein